MEPTSPRKVGVQISVNDDDSEEDKTTPESAVVKSKLDNHMIKQMSNLLKPYALANVDALLKKHLRSQMFLSGENYTVEVGLLVLHSGLWRWMPDFALKAVPQETGRLHVGLLIGPYIVDWTDSHLVAIRTLASCQPLVLLNLGKESLYSGSSEDEVNNVLRKASNVIVNWNTTKKFEKKNTCVNFVEEVLKAMGSKLKISSRVKDVLVDANKKGGDKFEATFHGDWAVIPGDKKAKKQKFKNHADLDEWVFARRKEHPDLETQHPDDWKYLVLIDRVFWCGKEGAGTEWTARDKPRDNGCAFGPPAFEKVMEMDLGSGPKKNQLIKKKKEAGN